MPQNPSPSTQPREYVTAAATRDVAPRVGLIPSTFAGAEELDGKKIRGLARPAPLDAELSAAQLEDMLLLAVELGGGRRGGLASAIGRDDWVVLKTSIQACPASPGYHPGAVTDPRLVAAVLGYLASHGLGRRFSIVEGAPCPLNPSLRDQVWNHFDGISFGKILDSLARKHPGLRFEVIDLNSAPSLQMPVEGRVFASRNPGGTYHVPRVLRECDRVISMAPLAMRPGGGIGLSMMNYLGFAPADRERNLGEPGEAAVDLFSFHPADYSIVGGTFGAEADGGKGTKMRRHNVILAGTNATAVDAVGAAVMGLESAAIRHLDVAAKRGYGVNDSYSIWTRGVEVEEVKADFRKAGA